MRRHEHGTVGWVDAETVHVHDVIAPGHGLWVVVQVPGEDDQSDDHNDSGGDRESSGPAAARLEDRLLPAPQSQPHTTERSSRRHLVLPWRTAYVILAALSAGLSLQRRRH